MKERLKHIAGIPRAVGLVWRSAPGWTIASAAILVVQGLLPLAAIYVMKLIIDGVADGVASPDKAAALGRVGVFVGIAAGIAVLNSVCQSLSNLAAQAQSQLVTDRVHEILHAKSVAVDLSYYENAKYHDRLHLAQREAPYRPTQIVQHLIRVGRNTISLLAVAGLLFALHWGLALVLLASAVPTVLVRIKFARGRFAWRRRATETQRRSRYLNWILTGGRHAKEIRLFDLGPTFIRRFSELRDRLRGERLSIAARESAAELVALSVSALAVFGAVGFAAYRTVYGVLTVGGLVMYYQAFQRGQGFLHQTLGGIAGLYESSLFLSNFYEFLDLEKRVVDPARPRPVPRPMSSGIVFDHVTFRYPGSERNAVQDVSLDVRPGEVVALVGENGAGKTTLVKLLCRLYDPTAGRVLVDGVDIREFRTAALRQEISVILQDYARFHLTARENIRLGNTELSAEDPRIVEAASRSGAHRTLSGLKHGYETLLGKWFEDGEELSVGEWQMVALARAFVRDAQILILDEPTASLDAKAEYEVFEKFRELAEGRTVLLISHRFSTVRMADRIYTLDRGRISESGTHDELVYQNGAYADLFEKQARHYR